MYGWVCCICRHYLLGFLQSLYSLKAFIPSHECNLIHLTVVLGKNIFEKILGKRVATNEICISVLPHISCKIIIITFRFSISNTRLHALSFQEIMINMHQLHDLNVLAYIVNSIILWNNLNNPCKISYLGKNFLK